MLTKPPFSFKNLSKERGNPLNGVIDVTKPPYSVPNDETGDASVGINNALLQSSAVYIPPGKYRTLHPIVVNPYQYLFGAGRSSELIYYGDKAAIKDDDGLRPCLAITIKDLSIKYAGNLALLPIAGSNAGAPFNPSAIVGLDCGNSQQSLFHGLWIENFSIGVLVADRMRQKDAFNVFSSLSIAGHTVQNPRTWGFHCGTPPANNYPGGASNGHLFTGCICSYHEIAFSFNFSFGNRVRGATAVNCQYGVYLLKESSNNEIDIYIEAPNVVVDSNPSIKPQSKYIGTAQQGSRHNLIRYHDDGGWCSPPEGKGFYTSPDATENVAVVLGTG